MTISAGRQVSVPLSSIVVRDEFNARQVYENIESLADSIRENGLEQPLVIYCLPDDERVYLQSGFRRHRAMTLIMQGRDVEVPCMLKGYGSHRTAMLAALAVDTTGEPLRNYDIAMRCKLLSEHYTHAQIGKAIGIPSSKVADLIQIYCNLDTKVVEYWQKCPTPDVEPPVARLRMWSQQPAPIQRKLLNEFAEGGTGAEILDKEGAPLLDESGKRRDKKKPSLGDARREIKYLERRQRTPKQEGMLVALKWMSGELLDLHG